MSQEDKRYNEYDEVNLVPFFRVIKKALASVLSGLVFTIRCIIKRFSLVLFLVIIGVILAVASFYFSQPLYHSSAIYASNLFGNEFSEQFVFQLEDLAEEKNYPELAALLKISEEDARKIKKIQYQSFKSGVSDSLVGAPFRVHVYVYDYNLLDSLQYRLLDYMENNDYALKRKSAKYATLEELSRKLEQEMVVLDTMKKNFSFGDYSSSMGLTRRNFDKTGQSSQYDIGYAGPMDIYSSSVELYTKALSLKEEIKLLKNYEIIHGFTKFVKPYSPRLFYDSFIYALIGFFTGVFFALVLELNRLRFFQRVLTDLKEEKGVEV